MLVPSNVIPFVVEFLDGSTLILLLPSVVSSVILTLLPSLIISLFKFKMSFFVCDVTVIVVPNAATFENAIPSGYSIEFQYTRYNGILRWRLWFFFGSALVYRW